MARNQKKDVTPANQNIPQTPMNTEGTGGEGGDNTPDSNANTASKEDINVVYVTQRPFLRGGKTYTIGEEVIGILDEDEITRLIKMGVIKAA